MAGPPELCTYLRIAPPRELELPLLANDENLRFAPEYALVPAVSGCPAGVGVTG
ncbi:MAG: hypothetical protein Q8R01_04165 [Ramlibacter sp.]|nr:hypothetical protein [Ramlibacter sp.]